MKRTLLIKTSWKRALLEIYFLAPNSWTEDSNCNRNTGNSPLQKKLIISNQEFAECISFLEEQKLIETKRRSEYQYWILTEKGFNVALELQKQVREVKREKNNEDNQASITMLTFVLALIGVTNLAKDIYPELKIVYFWIFTIFIITFLPLLLIVRRLRKR